MNALTSSLGLIALTVAAFAGGMALYQRLGKLPILQPVLLAIVAIAALLLATGLPYERYFEGTRPLHSLLGPAIVALAVPLYENLKKARASIVPLLGSVLLGGVAVTGSALVIGWVFGLDRVMELSLTTKSVTAPIALSIADKIGGSAALTILSVFTTGILGVIVTPSILRRIGVTDPVVSGLTLGITSHAFGIARSAELGSEAVAFATLGMALMGCASALIVPVLFHAL